MVLFITENYFDGFLKEAGKDHYGVVREASINLWNDYFGSNNKPKYIEIGTPGKVNPFDPYTSLFSIMSKTKDELRIKFLFREDYSEQQFSKAYGRYLDFLSDLSNGIIDEHMIEQLNQNPPVGNILLVT